MSHRARSGLFLAVLAAVLPLSGWSRTHDAWRAVLGDDVGGALAVYFDLQVETWVNVWLLAAALDVIYRVHRHEGGWRISPRSVRTRVLVQLGLLALVVAGAADGATLSVLEVVLPDGFAGWLASILRRGIEGVLATMAVLALIDGLHHTGRIEGFEPALSPTR